MFTLTQLSAAVRRGGKSSELLEHGMVGWRPEGVPNAITPYIYYPALDNRVQIDKSNEEYMLDYCDYYIEIDASTLNNLDNNRFFYTHNIDADIYHEVFFIRKDNLNNYYLSRYAPNSYVTIYNFGNKSRIKVKIVKNVDRVNVYIFNNGNYELIFESNEKATGKIRGFLNTNTATSEICVMNFYKVEKSTGKKINIDLNKEDGDVEWVNFITPDIFDYNPYTQQWESPTTTLTIPEKIDLFTSNGDIANKPSIYCHKSSYALNQWGEFKNIDLTKDFEIEFNNIDTLRDSTDLLRILTEDYTKYFKIQCHGLVGEIVCSVSAGSAQSIYSSFKVMNEDLTYSDFEINTYIESFIVNKTGNIITFKCNGNSLYLKHYDNESSQYIYLDYLDITNMNPTKNIDGIYYDASFLFSGQYTLKTLYPISTSYEGYFFVDKITVRQNSNIYESYIGRTGEIVKVDQLGNPFIEFLNMTSEDVIEFKNIPYTNVYENVDNKEFIKIDIE